MAAIPCISCGRTCCCLGEIIGIWALIVLFNADVKRLLVRYRMTVRYGLLGRTSPCEVRLSHEQAINHRRPQSRSRRRLHVLRTGPRQTRHRRSAIPPRIAGHRDAQPPRLARRTGSDRHQHSRLRAAAGQVRPAAERMQHGRSLRPDGRRRRPTDDRATRRRAHRRARHDDHGVSDAASAAAGRLRL